MQSPIFSLLYIFRKDSSGSNLPLVSISLYFPPLNLINKEDLYVPIVCPDIAIARISLSILLTFA